MVSPADEFDSVENEVLVALQENHTVTLSELMQRFVSEGKNPDIVREVVWGMLDSNVVQLTSDRKLSIDAIEQHATVS